MLSFFFMENTYESFLLAPATCLLRFSYSALIKSEINFDLLFKIVFSPLFLEENFYEQIFPYFADSLSCWTEPGACSWKSTEFF